MDNGLYFNNTINTKLPERWLRAVNFLIDVNMTATHHLSRIELLSQDFLYLFVLCFNVNCYFSYPKSRF